MVIDKGCAANAMSGCRSSADKALPPAVAGLHMRDLEVFRASRRLGALDAIEMAAFFVFWASPKLPPKKSHPGYPGTPKSENIHHPPLTAPPTKAV